MLPGGSVTSPQALSVCVCSCVLILVRTSFRLGGGGPKFFKNSRASSGTGQRFDNKSNHENAARGLRELYTWHYDPN